MRRFFAIFIQKLSLQFVETQINSINKVNLGTEYVLRLKKVIEGRLAWVTEPLVCNHVNRCVS